MKIQPKIQTHSGFDCLICMKTLKLALLLILASCSTEKQALEIATELNPDKYAGTWYEIARKPNRFEDGLEQITATYTLLENGDIEVLNQGIKNGERKQAKGKAWIPDPKKPAALKVSFFYPFRADYQVIWHDPNYQYSLVGEPDREYLWILARKPVISDSSYKALVNFAESKGFSCTDLILPKQSTTPTSTTNNP